MSTTFEVYPTLTRIPDMTELLTLANEKLHTFLKPFELQQYPTIGVRIGEFFFYEMSAPSMTTDWVEEYVWFFVTPNEYGRRLLPYDGLCTLRRYIHQCAELAHYRPLLVLPTILGSAGHYQSGIRINSLSLGGADGRLHFFG